MMAIATAALQTFVINGLIMMMFIFFGIKVLTRRKNRLSITLSGVFLIAAVGLLINILYRVIDNYQFNIIGNQITIILTNFSLIFLYSYTAIIRHSSKIFTVKKQILITIIYGLILCGLFLIPDGVKWAYENNATYETRDPSDLGVPVWNWWFAGYGLLFSQLTIILTIINGLVTFNAMGDQKSIYRRKYIYGLVGLLLLDVVIIGNYLFNAINTPTGRIILLIMSISIIPAGILIYYGFRQEKLENS